MSRAIQRLLLILAVALAADAGPRAAAPWSLPGTEALSELERIVVVYPAGPGEAAEINRLSGQRRAGFLHSLFGVEAVAVADDEVGDEQRAENLLVLGWDNRLLGTELAPRPFVRDGADRRFLGSVIVGPGEDLMFSVASPWNPERRLFFWSRIDLELDKFSVLPFLGSDWAVYRGYEVVTQGMFVDPRAWPPRRNVGAEMDVPNIRSIYPVQGRSEHYAVHHPPGLVDDERRAAILAARERALAAAIRTVGAPARPLHVDLYLLPDLDTKESLTGVPDPVHSLGRSSELFMLPQHALSDNPHEEAHLVAQAVYGPCHHSALHEGLAMIAEPQTEDGSFAIYAAALVDRQLVPSIGQLLDEEGVRGLTREGFGFPASGLLVTWILERGGRDALKRVYGARPLEETALAEALGSTAAEANRSFQAWVADLAAGGASAYRYQRARGEASRAGQNEDWPAAVRFLAEAAELRPGDADTLYRLALAEIRADMLEQAESHLRSLIDLAASDAGTRERYTIFGHYQLGEVLDRRGRTEAAREQYRRVLDLPDRYESHRMAREALDRIEGQPR